ncbi:MAG: hypothetical protein Q8P76_00710, partial [bacterium]|nr:hypothetical protein [bacterium]
MSNKQPTGFQIRSLAYIFSVIITTVIIVNYFALAATTTIGNNISTAGTLTVGGASTLSSTLLVSGAVNSSSTLQTTGNVHFYGDLTVDGNTNIGGLSFANATVTGNFFVGGDISLAGGDLNLGTGGATSTLSSASGRLGIGTSSPWGFFSVEMDDKNPSFVVSNNGSSTPSLFVGGTNQNGYVGIGTSTPDQALTVSGNISNLADSNFLPRARGSAKTSDDPFAVAVSGRYAYVVSFSGATFQVFDVSTSSPALVGVTTLSTGEPTSIVVSGKYAYVVACDSTCGGTPHFLTFDISRPNNPIELSNTQFGGAVAGVYDLAVVGRYAYVPTYDTNLVHIFDVADPSNPRIVSTITTETNPTAIAADGKYFYVANLTSGSLQIFEFSTSSPSHVGVVTPGGTPFDLDISGRYAYWVDYTNNILRIFDIANPASPSSLNTVGTGNTPVGVLISGRYAYVADAAADTLQVIDVSDPLTASSLGTVSINAMSGDFPVSMSISGRYIYIPSGGTSVDTLQILDVGGLETTSAIIHSLEAGSLQVRNDIIAYGQLQAIGGLSVGSGGIFNAGQLISASSTFMGSVGVGTTSPWGTFSVNLGSNNPSFVVSGPPGSTPALFVSGSSQGGLVGIGTSSPSQLLSVHGNAFFSGSLINVANITATGTLTVSGDSYLANASTTGMLTIGNGFISSASSTLSSGNLTITGSTGSIGIGSSTPWARLSIQANGGDSTRLISIASSSGDVYFEVSSTGTTTIEQLQTGSLTFDIDAGRVTWVDMPISTELATGTVIGYTAMINSSSTLAVLADVAGSGKITNQRIGIATSSPAGTLGIVAATTTPALYIAQTGSGNLMTLQSGNDAVWTVTNTGRLGLATTSPSQLLSVHGNAFFSGSLINVANITATGTLTFVNASTTGMLTV